MLPGSFIAPALRHKFSFSHSSARKDSEDQSKNATNTTNEKKEITTIIGATLTMEKENEKEISSLAYTNRGSKGKEKQHGDSNNDKDVNNGNEGVDVSNHGEHEADELSGEEESDELTQYSK